MICVQHHMSPRLSKIRQRLIHPRDQMTIQEDQYAPSNAAKCSELYIGETKQPLNRKVVQHRKLNTSGPETLDREYRWYISFSYPQSHPPVLSRVASFLFVSSPQLTLSRGSAGGFLISFSLHFLLVLHKWCCRWSHVLFRMTHFGDLSSFVVFFAVCPLGERRYWLCM